MEILIEIIELETDLEYFGVFNMEHIALEIPF